MTAPHRLEPRVLFTSGYSAGSSHGDFVLEDGIVLLSKPYSRNELLTSVRGLLTPVAT